jgi:uncharacterized protein
MNIWAIADLHLAFGVPEKSMEVFGPQWRGYAERMEQAWQAVVQPEDLVLIAGDISWAKTIDRAQADLKWIDSLPGTKVMIRGNHDYWWGSLSKVRKMLPPSIYVIQNDTFDFQNISIGGTRLWESTEYHFKEYIDYEENPETSPGMSPGMSPEMIENQLREQKKIFHRELERLELSLKGLKKEASLRIAMTHYPPIGADLKPSQASALFEKYGVTQVVFGHLHNVKEGLSLFGQQGAIRYHLTSADYLHFKPLKIYSSAK